MSNRLAKPVGHIRNFQVDFVRVDEGIDHNAITRELQSGNLPAVETAVPEVIRLQPLDEQLTRTGSWTLLDSENLLVGENEGSEVSCVITGTSCILLLCKHPWSGIAEIFVNDALFARVDLYNPHTTIPFHLSVESSSAPFTLRVRVSGQKAPISMGHQVLLRGIEQQSARMTRPQYEKVPHVRGAAFTQAFHECFLRVPESGLALDIGGGNRQIDDDRYINLDYAEYTEPDIRADALKLPFRDNSIDFIYSSGVFEHLKDPIAAGNEAFRVLKPGGSILVGMSFMQPIHSEGQHFFNATPWGIREIFKQFDIADVYWEGSLSFLFDWILKASGVAEQATERHLKTIRDTVALYEHVVSYDKLMYIANGVWLKGSKPLPQ